MNGVDALRRSYSELTPTERASMFLTEATGHRREEVVLSLRPPTPNEAIRECKAMIAMLVVAGHALTLALMAERKGLALLAMRKGTIDESIDIVVPYWTHSASWALALKQLEKETGHAFFAAAALLDGGSFLAEKVKGWDREVELDISGSLGELKQLWKTCERMIAT
jgi:hypothetical protein